jgi:hypothetical protein
MAITDLGVLRGWGGHDLVDRDGVKAGSISPGRSGVATRGPIKPFPKVRTSHGILVQFRSDDPPRSYHVR